MGHNVRDRLNQESIFNLNRTFRSDPLDYTNRKSVRPLAPETAICRDCPHPCAGANSRIKGEVFCCPRTGQSSAQFGVVLAIRASTACRQQQRHEEKCSIRVHGTAPNSMFGTNSLGSLMLQRQILLSENRVFWQRCFGLADGRKAERPWTSISRAEGRAGVKGFWRAGADAKNGKNERNGMDGTEGAESSEGEMR